MPMLTHPAKHFESKYYCHSSGKSTVFNHGKLRESVHKMAQINATLTDNRKQ